MIARMAQTTRRSAVARVEQALEQAAALEHLGAFWEIDAAGALARARAVDQDPSPGPLAGTVVAWKDCFDVAGFHTTAGAPWRDGAPAASESASIVKRMEAAGAVTLGKLAMTQLAWGMMGQTPGRPTCRNPAAPGRVPGGSSSGSAVAVASGIVDHAPGTDAGGSIRHPAASCGVVGFKPTFGSVPLDHCVPYTPSFDTGGPIARSVGECALAFSILSDRPLADLSAGRDGLRIGVLVGYFTAALEDEIAAVVESVAARLGAVELDLGWSRDDNQSMSPTYLAEPYQYLLANDSNPTGDRYDLTTLEDLAPARAVSAIDYLESHAELARARGRCRANALGFDVLLSAATPCVPVPLDGPDKTTRMNALAKPFNGLRWPAITLPAGHDRAGIPISIQLTAQPEADDLLLRAAAAVEVELSQS